MFLQMVAAVLQSRADRSRAPVHAVVRLQTGAGGLGLGDFEFGFVSFQWRRAAAVRLTRAGPPVHKFYKDAISDAAGR